MREQQLALAEVQKQVRPSAGQIFDHFLKFDTGQIVVKWPGISSSPSQRCRSRRARSARLVKHWSNILIMVKYWPDTGQTVSVLGAFNLRSLIHCTHSRRRHCITRPRWMGEVRKGAGKHAHPKYRGLGGAE